MTLERARELLRQRAQFDGGYQRSGALIRELDLGRIFGFAPGTRFE